MIGQGTGGDPLSAGQGTRELGEERWMPGRGTGERLCPHNSRQGTQDGCLVKGPRESLAGPAGHPGARGGGRWMHGEGIEGDPAGLTSACPAPSRGWIELGM